MKLFICSTGQDTGGWAARIQAAFARHAPDWTVRTTAATRSYMDYPADLAYTKPLVRQHYQQADVIHLRNSMAGWMLYDHGAGRPVVLQYHGSAYRAAHAELGAEARRIGAVQIVSTLDLTLFEGDVTWIGAPYNAGELRALRERHYQSDGVIRIAHAPTSRRVKGTEHFLRVMGRLQERYAVELVLIENQRWVDCLRQKATADIFYDQLELGYGNNAIEAWGMDIPVVAGVADPAVHRVMRERWGRLPFLQATPDTLEQRLEVLITSEQARQEWAAIGSEHFARFHDERVVVPQLAAIYDSAKPTLRGPVEPRARQRERDRRQRAFMARRAALRAARAA